MSGKPKSVKRGNQQIDWNAFWEEIREKIRSKLKGQFAEFYESWGVKFKRISGNKAECHAIGREDNNASAVVFLDNGNYWDSGSSNLGTGKAWDCFDVMIQTGRASDHRSAVEKLGKELGIDTTPPRPAKPSPKNPSRAAPDRSPARGKGATPDGSTACKKVEIPTIQEEDTDPDRLADKVLEAFQTKVDGILYHKIAKTGGKYYHFNGVCYEEVSTDWVYIEIHKILRMIAHDEVQNKMAVWESASEKERSKKPPTPFQVTGKLKSDVLGALDTHIHLEDPETWRPIDVAPPAWILKLYKQKASFPVKECLIAQNGIIHVPSIITPDGKWDFDAATIDHTPALFSTDAVPYAIVPTLGQPTLWLEHLRQWFPDDKPSNDDGTPNPSSSINAIKEIFGYCLLPDTSHQKIFVIVGPTRSGKGTIGRVLTALLGAKNVASTTLHNLADDKFSLEPMRRARLAILGDAKTGTRSDSILALERLLAISGEDAVDVRPMHHTAITTRLSTRFMILCNELPSLKDAAGALLARLVVVQMTKSFQGREDKELTDRLLEELPQIALWAIQGYHQLRYRRRFGTPDSSLEMMREYQNQTNPVATFVRQFCKVGEYVPGEEPEYEIPTSELYKRWKHYCDVNGIKNPGDAAKFGSELRAATNGQVYSVQARRKGVKMYVYRGIKFQP